MNCFALFTDVSLNPKHRLGIGAYLLIPCSYLETSLDSIDKSRITELIIMKKFEGTSSTELEVKTVLWALEDHKKALKPSGRVNLNVYSDSQCIADLQRRRPDLELNAFYSKRTNRLLKNASLYRTFYELMDDLDFKVIKVSGHGQSSSHDTVHRIFSFVDRKVRHELKLWMKGLGKIHPLR